MVTLAPPCFKFENISVAFFLSRRVFPINVPNPKPPFEFKSFDFDVIYGCPIILKTSSGKPGPSSIIFIFI